LNDVEFLVDAGAHGSPEGEHVMVDSYGEIESFETEDDTDRDRGKSEGTGSSIAWDEEDDDIGKSTSGAARTGLKSIKGAKGRTNQDKGGVGEEDEGSDDEWDRPAGSTEAKMAMAISQQMYNYRLHNSLEKV